MLIIANIQTPGDRQGTNNQASEYEQEDAKWIHQEATKGGYTGPTTWVTVFRGEVTVVAGGGNDERMDGLGMDESCGAVCQEPRSFSKQPRYSATINPGRPS